MTDDDLEQRLGELEETFGAGRTSVYILPGPGEGDDVDLSPYTVRIEPGEEDPIDYYEEVHAPVFKPRSARGGVRILDAEDIVRLWDALPDDVRERELEYRIEHGEPIPPVLQE